MIEIKVSSEREYSVHIGANWREELLEISRNFAKVLVIAPQHIIDLFELENVLASFPNLFLHSVADGEEQKTLVSIESVWSALAEKQLGRKDAIVAIGGGATTDLAGFAAATWLRGIDWFAFPSTLAGAVDAAVGGKTGINSPAGKNLIGSFYSPRAVFIDVSFLATLSDRDFAAGLAEVIKTGFIASEEILTILESCANLDDARVHVERLIALSVSVKARVVSEDFKEGKLREILNYGHTLGHAIERSEGFTWRHGEAIAVGLVFAAELSHSLCDLPTAIVDSHRKLLAKFGLPITYSAEKWDALLEFMRLDKKVRSASLRFIGISEVGRPQWLENVQDEKLAQTYERISQ